MKKSLFVGSFRGTEEKLKNFMESNLFSFEKKVSGKITILRSYDYVMSEIKNYNDFNLDEKEIYAIEMETEETLLINIMRIFRNQALENGVDVTIVKNNNQELEFISIYADGDINYSNKDCNLIDSF